jgi:hypothetical protein
MQATSTKHTCGGPHFGKRTPGCARCDELANGAAARQQPARGRSQQIENDRRATIAAHNCKVSNCSIVCVAFDW